MNTFLWESMAFGPIKSRRLGSSLGVNLLPTEKKICTFNCIYCECGWTLEKQVHYDKFPSKQDVLGAIEAKLKQCVETGTHVDSITFSGNGEPTLHPDFPAIIDELLLLRKRYYPAAVITCLSNATQLHRPEVVSALRKIENPILKLDAGTDEMLQIINKPVIPLAQEDIVENLKKFGKGAIIQTLFLKGIVENCPFDNTVGESWQRWLETVRAIAPRKVMLYSLDRNTPQENLQPVTKADLELLAQQVRRYDIVAEIY